MISAGLLSSPVRAVVLGASGFLGSALTQRLLSCGHSVVGLSRHRSISAWQLDGRYRHITSDVSSSDSLADALSGADIVFHMASATHPVLNINAPETELNQSLVPVLQIMKAAKHAHVKKVVFPSSGGTVYASQNIPSHELTRTDPLTPYAIFKLAAENLLLSASRQGDFAVDVMRIANPYGPTQPIRPGQGVLPHWLDAIIHDRPITIFGDGLASRDYIFVDDVVHCLESCCHRLNQTDTFNVGTGTSATLIELANKLQKMWPKPIDINFVEARPSDLPCVLLDSSKLLQRLPDFHWTSLSNGLEQCVKEVSRINKLDFLHPFDKE